MPKFISTPKLLRFLTISGSVNSRNFSRFSFTAAKPCRHNSIRIRTLSCSCPCPCRQESSDKSSAKRKAVFLGSDAFSVPSLLTLASHLGRESVVVVVSNFNTVVGKFANRTGIRTVLWEEYKKDGFGEDKGFDYGVVASFGYLIPQRIIERFPLGILNVHGSLLPKWRGAAPIAHAIMAGDTFTGVSIMQIAPHRFDVGPVLLLKEVPIHPHIKRPELTAIMAELGAEALKTVISDLDHYLAHPIFQDEAGATKAPKLVPEMANVDWNGMDAVHIYNLFRGLNGMYPLKTKFSDKIIDLDEIGLVTVQNADTASSPNCDTKENERLSAAETFYPTKPIVSLSDDKFLANACVPGQTMFRKDIDTLFVRCGETSQSNYLPYVVVRKVKVGTKWMSGKDFQNGFLSKCKPSERILISIKDTIESNMSQLKEINSK